MKTEDCSTLRPKVVLKETRDNTPRLGFTTTAPILGKLVDTPEGYLVCRDVALARTGTQIYLGYETPLEAGPDGTVVVERLDEEVFRPETIESFRGKPFTNDHPITDVAGHNYKEYMVGTVMNPRRGEGDRSHCLLGDIIIYDPTVVAEVKAGKREVSAGYDSDYEKLEAGRGIQRNILANHVSLVAEGRCGPTCAIMDHKGTTDMAKKSTFMDNLRAAFKARDEDAFEEAINEAAKEGVDESSPPERMDTEEKEGGSNQHHVTVNIGGMTPDSMNAMRKDTAKDEETVAAAAPAAGDMGDLIKAAVAEALAPVVARLDAIEGAVEDVSDPEDRITTDAVARAELLRPGIKLPTFDAKPGSAKARDAVTAFQRQVLAEAFATQDGREAIAPLVGSARPNFATMPAGEVAVVFRGASERMRDANNARQVSNFPVHVTADGQRKTFDNAAWNERNKQFWNRA